jgi:TatD DNase family protein
LLIDSHTHLDLAVFDDDRDQVLARARNQGVTTIINMGLDIESSQASLHIAHHHPDVFTAVGFHPSTASKMQEGNLNLLAKLAEDAKVVAIGEIGLDFYRKSTPRQCQLEVFQQQLNLAVELGLPVVIHSRQAHKEMLDILARWVKSTSPSTGSSPERGVIHCFSGDTKLAWRYIELGFLVSLAGPVTYPSALDRVEVAREMPLDKLLVETDSPFLPPQPYRGQRNEPSYVSLIVEKIAQIKGVPSELVAQITAQNTISLFQLSSN